MNTSLFSSAAIKMLLICIVFGAQISMADENCNDRDMPSLEDMVNGCVRDTGLPRLGTQFLDDICVCQIRLYWNTATTTCAERWSYLWQNSCEKFCKDIAARLYSEFTNSNFVESANLNAYQKCESDL